ncbi:MAG TPA: dTDP-4-dehydrorhamnose 3,5-epimerase [Candidatus Sulfotelmatobacter sp.]|nr:dTDP-4-dehydrorhamnose 3,5-epimerase [Candidatus Sulfotelmatobacter sp.]
MQIIPTEIPDVLLLEPRVFEDSRGVFLEIYQERKFAAAGIDARFVQDNLSESRRGVLRGLHFQVQQAQGKLIHILQGEIFDVAVDLRKGSPSFGKWVGVTLSSTKHHALWIPAGFAHGFYVCSDTAKVLYKVTDFYAPEHERTLLWNDPDVGIAWPLQGEPILSDKDRAGQLLRDV